jgi:hypothetical protein
MGSRFRLVPTFGRDTIRRFSKNTSDLKRMAARDYEDILQVSLLIAGLEAKLLSHMKVCDTCFRGFATGTPQYQDSSTFIHL